MAPEALPARARRIGYTGVDPINEALWSLASRHGLTVSAARDHGPLTDGLNRPANATRIETELHANIHRAAAASTLARLAPWTQAARVTLALESLNSRVDHPDYMADHTAWTLRLCEQANSPAVRVLYDIYHTQIMEGDIRRTIETHHRLFSHYHTAGNSGRGRRRRVRSIARDQLSLYSTRHPPNRFQRFRRPRVHPSRRPARRPRPSPSLHRRECSEGIQYPRPAFLFSPPPS